MVSPKNMHSTESSNGHLVNQMTCPSCRGPLKPIRLLCTPCDLSVDGRFQVSEFSNLTPDDLHFLRIFIHCEGSIREMESALGLSYPTIKSRLANLKKTLTLDHEAPPPPRELKSVGEVLTALEKGEITHAESLKLIRKFK